MSLQAAVTKIAMSFSDQAGTFPFKLLIVVSTLFFMAHETVEMRRDWVAADASVQQIVVFKEQAKLIQVQQRREAAEVDVALSSAARNVQDEIRAVAEREATVLSAFKPLQEGWGDSRTEAAFIQVRRYNSRYNEAASKLQRCKDCSDSERRRLSAEMDVYHLLFYSTLGNVAHLLTGKETITVPTEYTPVMHRGMDILGGLQKTVIDAKLTSEEFDEIRTKAQNHSPSPQ